ncbi:hypothetical protein NQ318_003075 [Aromia moschata]|uniref:Cytochrome P450 n=1 Tax=Aromia moschata TaxID=1265417 RepID=A0AAV8XPF2_9CUCU|nr:hypothetical protein NQ318_003075 [Aromia moschata]
MVNYNSSSKWQTRRKLLTPAFHFKILQQFIIVFNNETRNLVEVLKKECHKSHLNVVPYISQFTLCTIKETSMGNSLNLKNEEDKTYFTTIHQIGKVLMYRLKRPWLYPKYPYFIFPAGMMEKKILHAFTNTVIREKSENFETLEETENEEFNYEKRKKLAMLDLLLNAKLNGLIDDKGIQDEVNTFIFEGHDTSAMSICFTLMLLASHKDVQELIVQEINHVLPDPNTPPSYNDLQELKYMERCIKESLRLYPSVPFISRTLEEDIVVSTGHTLPKSSMANVNILDIHRNPKIWPDPERFDPDRFLLENCVNRHPFAYVPFSAGPRNCIGQRFAVLEIKAVLCGILRNFILEPVDTPENITLVIGIILRSEKGYIRVKFTPRS